MSNYDSNCERCGDEVQTSELFYTEDGEYFCEDCFVETEIERCEDESK